MHKSRSSIILVSRCLLDDDDEVGRDDGEDERVEPPRLPHPPQPRPHPPDPLRGKLGGAAAGREVFQRVDLPVVMVGRGDGGGGTIQGNIIMGDSWGDDTDHSY